MDMTAAIAPKSDQLNADDLIAGPITITVTGVTVTPGEQPVSIFYEGDKGKPYKCCKSMARILVSAWGPDSKQYVGRSMTLYRDPTVKWAGLEVGGIRISHLSDIVSPMTMALTVKKQSRKPFTVKPLESAVRGNADQAFVTVEQATELEDMCKASGVVDKFLAQAKVETFAHVLAEDYAGGKKWIERQKV